MLSQNVNVSALFGEMGHLLPLTPSDYLLLPASWNCKFQTSRKRRDCEEHNTQTLLSIPEKPTPAC